MSTASGSGAAPERVAAPERGGRTRTWSWGEAAIAVGLFAVGVFTLVETTSITVPGSANVLGPRAFPYAVGVLLVGASVALAVSLLRGQHGSAEEGEDVDAGARTDWGTVAKLVASFAALVLLIEPLGWPIAATLLFAGTAWALGARIVRAAVIGAVLNVGIHVLFVQVLGLFLPAGPLEGVPFFG
ncbi:putative tricarboxylic transport membrane protein [Blastococcus sp. DSM 46786]|uniref:tripartite tricarboxylate transporter TctB family protein n=1 Tax=Blastococcus sp. DSM 46786 TaxID=1798227 RepID=UPI0008B601FD|nr:tripartite tricarboxylate transporter TctB family protein [Blastococcus sp. DSM 46786]SEL59757.1 putative tricarboxylic transport membrane protein [Blastococcus sp. DSM 46786]